MKIIRQPWTLGASAGQIMWRIKPNKKTYMSFEGKACFDSLEELVHYAVSTPKLFINNHKDAYEARSSEVYVVFEKLDDLKRMYPEYLV